MTHEPIKNRRNLQLTDLRRHEDGCAVRGCQSPTAFRRTVEIHDSPGATGGKGRLVVLGYCKPHLDQIAAFKDQAAA